MIALVAGFFLVGYLLAPGAIYRLAFSFFIPSKRFQRTRTEEIVFSVFAVSLPFILTWILLCHTPIGAIPALHSLPSKNEAYRLILQNLLSSSSMPNIGMVDAYRRVMREQARFLVWLWSLCFIEGLLTGLLVNGYGSFAERSIPKWLCDQFLLKHVSEWQILFTTITLPSTERERAVEVDILCSGTLYRGRLVNWFTDQDGKLAGIFITEAQKISARRLGSRQVSGQRFPSRGLLAPNTWG
jgi:hypothetical protein